MNRKNLVLHARKSIERGSKSFSRASKLFSRPTRERAWLLYSWCRACDDLADGQDHGHGMSTVANPEKAIAAMRMMTRRAHGGEQTGNPPFDAFGIVAQECNIPLSLANDMIDGFALDARGWQPESEDDLFQYCYHVAGTVGCMMAIVMGISANDQDVLDRACDLGLAFQLANIARDVAEDAQAGRCYLPKIWLAEAGIDPDDMMNPDHRDALIALINRLCDLAGEYEQSARSGAANLPFRSRWAVLAAAGIYGDIARAIKKSDGASLEQRIYTSKFKKLGWIVKAFGQALFKSTRRDREALWTRERAIRLA
ncbi:phytoene/squalene synthase family protein [uncultured Parasphingorhabdus sp.]|uniref:phytoene/squalene synthase family protein n=1 Tax=uncultured Parasphingorhabdus sp. TaxID=2709694 RepID=UPI0030DC1424|tara:strand:- start:52297 stop:53232 length:936 start_codon:yes stop_codon:yes gene_type:complete